MGDVIQFGRKALTDAHGELYLTVQFYDTPGMTDVVIRREDGGELDLPDIIDRLSTCETFVYEDLHRQTGDDDNQLLLTTRIFASSRTRSSWLDDDILTPTGTAWLRRRFDDAYHDLDRRRGLRYLWFRLKRAADEAWRNLTNKDEPT